MFETKSDKEKWKDSQFGGEQVTVETLVNALRKFPMDAEVCVMMGSKKWDIAQIFDNRKWGNDNELAIIEIEP